MPDAPADQLDNGREIQNKSNWSVLAIEAVFSSSSGVVCPRTRAFFDEPVGDEETEAAHGRRSRKPVGIPFGIFSDG